MMKCEWNEPDDCHAGDDCRAVRDGGEIEHTGDYERLTQESLRGRTGGGVTLAVGTAAVFGKISGGADWL